MREGSLEAPTRHPIDWQSADYYDADALDKELRRVFDICHGCRLCFNLCDSFPRLFDLIDEGETGELDSVDSADFAAVADACTLCDMCFMTKCPYVPPHDFNLDFPHMMLRYKAIQNKDRKTGFWDRQLTRTDRNGRLCSHVPGAAGIANWMSKSSNKLTRGMLQSVAGVDKRAALPKFYGKTLTERDLPADLNKDAPAFGRKAVLYATCFSNYNNPQIGEAMARILAHNGVETEVVYPSCCGMPQFEHGDIAAVADSARSVARELRPYVDQGYDIIGLVPSCSLMLKFEWPLIVPDDDNVKALAQASFDASEYIVNIARKEGLADGLKPLDGGITLHIACHARAQNMGQKAAEMLRLIPDHDLAVIERCSGHGGSWGVKKENFDTALKVGKTTARRAISNGKQHVASECPLAGVHILQGMEAQDAAAVPDSAPHPIELFALAYGLA